MLGFAKVRRHVAEEITLLCDQHHREKTSGLLPTEKVREANDSPYNTRSDVSRPYDLHYSGSEVEAVIGGNTFRTKDEGYGTVTVPVSVDGIPLLAFILGDGHLLLNLNLFDECNTHVIQIKNNCLLYASSLPWDIQLKGRNLVVREKRSKILVDLTFEVPNRIVINRGRLLCNGVEIILRPDHLLITNNATLMSGCEVAQSTYGLRIGGQSGAGGAAFAVDRVPRYVGNRSEAIKWAKEAMANRTDAGEPGGSLPDE